MDKIRKKLTIIGIILLGLLATTPALIANPAPVYKERQALRQEIVLSPQRRLNIVRFLNRIRRQIRRNRTSSDGTDLVRRRRIKQRVRRYRIQKIRRAQVHHQCQCGNDECRWNSRP